MNGMIFAAGLGTRLSPITDNKPKALVEVGGKPLLWHAINNFYNHGIRYIVVNVHHFPSQIIDYLQTVSWDGLKIAISDESDTLLDTGGGLVNARKLFMPHEPVLIGNADVLSNADLSHMMQFHKQHKPLVTLMTMQRPSTRQLVFNHDGLLSGWVNHQNGDRITARNEQNTHESAFCGFHIVEQAFIDMLPQEGAFPIMDAYLSRAAEVAIRESVMPPRCHWFDVGTVDKLEIAETFMVTNNRGIH